MTCSLSSSMMRDALKREVEKLARRLGGNAAYLGSEPNPSIPQREPSVSGKGLEGGSSRSSRTPTSFDAPSSFWASSLSPPRLGGPQYRQHPSAPLSSARTDDARNSSSEEGDGGDDSEAGNVPDFVVPSLRRGGGRSAGSVGGGGGGGGAVVGGGRGKGVKAKGDGGGAATTASPASSSSSMSSPSGSGKKATGLGRQATPGTGEER
jgi:hypothetical protein